MQQILTQPNINCRLPVRGEPGFSCRGSQIDTEFATCERSVVSAAEATETLAGWPVGRRVMEEVGGVFRRTRLVRAGVSYLDAPAPVVERLALSCQRPDFIALEYESTGDER